MRKYRAGRVGWRRSGSDGGALGRTKHPCFVGPVLVYAADQIVITIKSHAQRLHVLCFTPVPGGIRVISFRKANLREVKSHGQNHTTDE